MTRARDLADFNLDGKAVTVNESSADLDFRVESNGNANMLFVDGGNDKVAIGTGTAVGTLTTECTAGDSNFALTAYHPTSTSARTIAKFQSNVGGTQQDKVVILCDSKVGINTSSPSGALLDIFTGSTSTDGLKINRFDTGVYYSTLRQDTHGLAIHVGDGSSIAERAAITPNGITFGGDTASANALDDYEEGTFTPTYVGLTISSVSSNNGKYTKIGNMVLVQVDLQDATWSSGGGHLGISNLPFSGGAQRAFTGTFAWYYLVSNLGTADALAGYVAGGTSSMMMYASQNNHIWHTIATPSSGSNGYFNGTFMYTT